jgi:hypothetical protein
MTQTAINSTSIQSANTKALGSVSYDESNNRKAGTILVSYGAGNITFSTVADYLIFVNEVIIPMTNKIHSASGAGVGYVAINPGTAGADAITD